MAMKTLNHGSHSGQGSSSSFAVRPPFGQPSWIEGGDVPVRFQFWRGATTKRYIHNVFPLLACPELPSCNYVLVRLNADGSRTPLRVGRACDQAGSLNRARVRRLAAQLGANEVHVHLIGETEQEQKMVEMDLCAGLFGTLSAEPAGVRVH